MDNLKDNVSIKEEKIKEEIERKTKEKKIMMICYIASLIIFIGCFIADCFIKTNNHTLLIILTILGLGGAIAICFAYSRYRRLKKEIETLRFKKRNVE